MKTRFIWLLPFLILGIILASCSPKTKYNRKLKQELASGERHDTMFMGIYLGMPQKEFYTRCWKLNMQGIIRQGASNTTVEYQIKKELKYPGTMNFYPTFTEGKITEMPVRFKYNGWAPWNKKLSSDSLQLDVLNWYIIMYGDGFMEVEHPTRGKAYVKLDGNRRITLFKSDDMHVWAVYTDMQFVKDRKAKDKDFGDIPRDTTLNPVN